MPATVDDRPFQRTSGARPGRSLRKGIIAIWVIALIAAGAVVARVPFVADMSIFLPQHPTAEQRLLVDNLRSGALSRLLLIGVAGVGPAQQGTFSRLLAQTLRDSKQFGLVINGDLDGLKADQSLLFERRYVLSPAITAEHFETAALHSALQSAIEGLASSQSALLKQLLPRDPTGEVLRLLTVLQAGGAPATRDGVWIDSDGQRTVAIAYSLADGGDLDGQQQAIDAVHQAFDTARTKLGAADARLDLSGPAVFAVQSRASIQRDVHRLSTLGSVLIIAMLAFVFRSPVAMALAIVPLISAIAAGAAAIALGFGALHGMAVGFGITLIGEAVDYALYQLIRSDLRGAAYRAFWRTILLGVATSIAGFSALALSGFPGLSQMAFFSIAGLLAAVAATRWVVPALTPASFQPPRLAGIDRALHRIASGLARARAGVAIAVLMALAWVVHERDRLWDPDIASLNPISAAAGELDQALRRSVAAPDVRTVLVVRGDSTEAVLQATEQVDAALDTQIAAGRLASYQSPSTFLPSLAMQAARRKALPDAEVLRARLVQACEGLPIKPERLQPFVEQVQAARTQAPLTLKDFGGTQLGLRIESQLSIVPGASNAQTVTAIVSLTAVGDASLDESAIAAALPRVPGVAIDVIDIKRETDRLYAGYLDEAIHLSIGGALAIVVLLALAIRSVGGVVRVTLPLLGAIVLTLLAFVLLGHRMNLLHLIGLLLVVAIGSNYALFFRNLRPDISRADRTDGTDRSGGADRENDQGGRGGHGGDGTLASLAFANLATVTGFGVLAASSVPLLSALGETVALGAALALLLSCAALALPSYPAVQTRAR